MLSSPFLLLPCSQQQNVYWTTRSFSFASTFWLLLRMPSSADPALSLSTPTPRVPSAGQCAHCKCPFPAATEGAWIKAVPPGGLLLCESCAGSAWSAEIRVTESARAFECCPLRSSWVPAIHGVCLTCSSCGGRYHSKCVGITDPKLLVYLSATSTKWVCPEQQCGPSKLTEYNRTMGTSKRGTVPAKRTAAAELDAKKVRGRPAKLR